MSKSLKREFFERILQGFAHGLLEEVDCLERVACDEHGEAVFVVDVLNLIKEYRDTFIFEEANPYGDG